MKAQLTGKNKKGFATLEVLIAFAILIMSISAVIMVVFGNQSITIDTETNNEAIAKAKKGLEDARALSRKDFISVTSSASSVEMSGPLAYTKKLDVIDLAQCEKQATSTIT